MSEDETRSDEEAEVEAHQRTVKATEEDDDNDVEAHQRTVKASDDGDDDFEAHSRRHG